MAQLPKIYIIQASDAPRHSATLQGILAKLKDEQRINSFQVIQLGDSWMALDDLADGDLVVTLLTKDLESEKIQLEKTLDTLKEKSQDLKIAEIIVDQIPYENAYLTFPEDLRPIRGREDMDAVWAGIEQSLKNMFPVQEVDPDPDPGFWSKYGKYVIALVVILLLVWLVPKLFQEKGPEVSFKYRIWDAQTNNLLDTSICYAPCIVYFNNNTLKFDSLIWDFGDTTLSEEDPKYLFLESGDYSIKLTAFSGKNSNFVEKKLLVKVPPMADFEIGENGCIAPCDITFTNISEHADEYVWEFGDGTPRSTEENPKKKYETPDVYRVKLTARNQDGVKSEIIKEVTISEDNSPFADFNIRKTGAFGSTPRKIVFQNLSKNADQFIWNFGDGSNAISTNSTPNIEHTYSHPGSYTVVLTAKRNNMESTGGKTFYIGPNELHTYYPIDRLHLQKINENPQLKKQMENAQLKIKVGN